MQRWSNGKMKSLKLKEQWRRFFNSQLENIAIAKEDFDVEEDFFLRGIFKNYKEPLFTRMCNLMLDKYNKIIDYKLDQKNGKRI